MLSPQNLRIKRLGFNISPGFCCDSPISSTIYAPAIPTIADQFGKSIEAINLTVTMYL
jgi:hypothetical protein